MANAKILRWGPNATYIPLTGIGVSCWGITHILGLRENFASQRSIGLRASSFKVFFDPLELAFLKVHLHISTVYMWI